MRSDEVKRGTAELVLAMCLSGTIGLFVVESGQSPINVVFFRCAIGGACLLVYCVSAKLFGKTAFTPRNVGLLLVVGLSIVLNWLCLFSAFSYVSIGLSVTIYHVQPFVVFFVGALLFHTRLSKARMLWLAIAFLGVVLIIHPDPRVTGERGRYLVGCGLSLLAALLYGTATLASKKIKGVPPHVIALCQMLIGVLVLAPFVRFADTPATAAQWGCLVTLGVVHSALMYILIYSAYQKLDTGKIAILAYVYPVVAVLVDYVYFGRVLSPAQMGGGAMVLVAGLCGTLDVGPRQLLAARRRARLDA